ncbi:MAG TPA: hypothetical protein VM432_14650 [Bdellovibrionales bacterium]|nr:hypothetical protein [Bdellovibrionales bacterium]
MHKFPFISVVVASLVLTACGPTNYSPYKDHEDRESREVRDLSINPEPAKDLKMTKKSRQQKEKLAKEFRENLIEFNSLRYGVPQKKFMLFKAPANGVLTFSKRKEAKGFNCRSKQETAGGDFKSSFSLALKDQSGRYDAQVSSDAVADTEKETSIALEKGEDLQITLELTAYSGCPSIHFIVDAKFISKK